MSARSSACRPPRVRERDAVPDPAKLFHAWALIRQVRNPEGLVAILEHFFQVPVRIAEFVAQWMPHRPARAHVPGARQCGARRRRRRRQAGLGQAAQVSRSASARSRFGGTRTSCPSAATCRHLIDWVQLYLSLELDWDVQLVLKGADVPALRLGGGVRLGWTTWAGTRRTDRDADDLRLDLRRSAVVRGGWHERDQQDRALRQAE